MQGDPTQRYREQMPWNESVAEKSCSTPCRSCSSSLARVPSCLRVPSSPGPPDCCSSDRNDGLLAVQARYCSRVSLSRSHRSSHTPHSTERCCEGRFGSCFRPARSARRYRQLPRTEVTLKERLVDLVQFISRVCSRSSHKHAPGCMPTRIVPSTASGPPSSLFRCSARSPVSPKSVAPAHTLEAQLRPDNFGSEVGSEVAGAD